MIVLRTELTTIKSYHPAVGNKSYGVSHTVGERFEEIVIQFSSVQLLSHVRLFATL